MKITIARLWIALSLVALAWWHDFLIGRNNDDDDDLM